MTFSWGLVIGIKSFFGQDFFERSFLKKNQNSEQKLTANR